MPWSNTRCPNIVAPEMANSDVEKGNSRQASSYQPLDENGTQPSSGPHPVILVLGSVLLLSLIWVPIWYLGLLKHILAQILGPVIAIVSLLALLPVLAIGMNALRKHIGDSVEYHKEHLKGQVTTAMHSKIDIVKESLEGVVGGSITEGLQNFEKKMAELEEKLMKKLEQMPNELKTAVRDEFQAMKKMEGAGWHQHAKK